MTRRIVGWLAAVGAMIAAPSVWAQGAPQLLWEATQSTSPFMFGATAVAWSPTAGAWRSARRIATCGCAPRPTARSCVRCWRARAPCSTWRSRPRHAPRRDRRPVGEFLARLGRHGARRHRELRRHPQSGALARRQAVRDGGERDHHAREPAEPHAGAYNCVRLGRLRLASRNGDLLARLAHGARHRLAGGQDVARLRRRAARDAYRRGAHRLLARWAQLRHRQRPGLSRWRAGDGAALGTIDTHGLTVPRWCSRATAARWPPAATVRSSRPTACGTRSA